MVGTLASSDQDIDAGVTTLSNRARFWLLTVAALDVLLVISSMVALKAALPRYRAADCRDADATDLDHRRIHTRARMPAAARGHDG